MYILSLLQGDEIYLQNSTLTIYTAENCNKGVGINSIEQNHVSYACRTAIEK